MGLGGIWRSLVIWRERHLLYELGSSLQPFSLSLTVALGLIVGSTLLVTTVGLWLKKEWSRRLARIAIPTYLLLGQAYIWLFVRSGLMWERRWMALVLSMSGVALGIVLPTWSTTRRWLGLQVPVRKT